METISPVTVNIIRWIARIFSAIIVLFALFMFIGESMEAAHKANADVMSLNAIMQLTIFGAGLLALVLAWKWELLGGSISLFAFVVLFIVNPNAQVWLMLIFPLNAILFIVLGYFSKIREGMLID
jgi:hypothetical protein